METISFAIGDKTDRFSVKSIEIFEQEEDDPGFVRYHLTPTQACLIIVRLWRMLEPNERPTISMS